MIWRPQMTARTVLCIWCACQFCEVRWCQNHLNSNGPWLQYETEYILKCLQWQNLVQLLLQWNKQQTIYTAFIITSREQTTHNIYSFHHHKSASANCKLIQFTHMIQLLKKGCITSTRSYYDPSCLLAVFVGYIVRLLRCNFSKSKSPIFVTFRAKFHHLLLTGAGSRSNHCTENLPLVIAWQGRGQTTAQKIFPS